jgi:hypothetical protein
MRRDQGEGRRQHLIQIHWMNLTSPAQPGNVTERGPLTELNSEEAVWSSLKDIELANLTSPTPAEVIDR